MKKILKFLDGKKVKILAAVTTTSSFCVAMGYIQPEVGAYLTTIAGIILGSASHVTPGVLGFRKKIKK